MRPGGRSGEMFRAFSRICGTALADDRLLSCGVLSKSPSYGQALDNYLAGAPPFAPGFWGRVRLCCRYALANAGNLAFMLASLVFARLSGWRLPPSLAPGAPAQQFLVIDTFALLPEIAASGVYRERYLPGLAEEAAAAGRPALVLYRFYGSRRPGVLRRAVRALAAKGGGMCEAQLLAWSDWPRLVRHVCLYPFSLLRLIRSLEGHAPGTPESYIRDALRRGAGGDVTLGEARRLAGLRLGLLLAAHPGSHIVSWYENQTVNKAFQRGLRQAGERSGRKTPLTGAQLFIWPPNLLNNHPDDGEAALGLAPDRVLVNGPYFLPEDSSQRYETGPSLRYAHLFAARGAGGNASPGPEPSPAPGAEPDAEPGPEPGPEEGASSGTTPPGPSRERGPVEPCPRGTAPPDPEPGPSPSGRQTLLALLSYHPEEIRRTLRLLRSLGDTAARSGLALAVKFHPAVRPDAYAADLPPGAALVDAPLMEALAGAAAVIGSGSGSLAEAVALGTPVLCVEERGEAAERGLNYLPDSGRGLLWESVATGAQTGAALARLLEARADPGRSEAVAAFKALLFTEPTSARIRRAFF